MQESQERNGAGLLILGFMGFLFLTVIMIAMDSIEEMKYNNDCKTFTVTFDQVPFDECIKYLEEFPEMTGQEMIDYHESTFDRLLSKQIYEPNTSGNEPRRPTYEYTEFKNDCYVFIRDLTKEMETDLTKSSCVNYLKQNSTLTGQQMLDFHEKYKQSILEKPVNMR